MKIIVMRDSSKNIDIKRIDIRRPIGILCHNYTNSIKRLALAGNNEKYYVAGALIATSSVIGVVSLNHYHYKNFDKYL